MKPILILFAAILAVAVHAQPASPVQKITGQLGLYLIR
jgi:hypothetical protein